MGIFSLEHSPAANRADFALYGIVIAALLVYALVAVPIAQWAELIGWMFAGLAFWTLVEYLLHRFVLHHVAPFKHWHAAHHQRPMALIGSPTVLSATLIFVLVFVPAWLAGGRLPAYGLTLGVLAGYLAYGITHHATHHWRANHRWLAQRKRWHSMHHHFIQHPGCYGVTSGFWDRVFGTVATRGVHTDGSNRIEEN